MSYSRGSGLGYALKVNEQFKVAEMNNVAVAEDAVRVGRHGLHVQESSVTAAKVADGEDAVRKLNDRVLPRNSTRVGIKQI